MAEWARLSGHHLQPCKVIPSWKREQQINAGNVTANGRWRIVSAQVVSCCVSPNHCEVFKVEFIHLLLGT